MKRLFCIAAAMLFMSVIAFAQPQDAQAPQGAVESTPVSAQKAVKGKVKKHVMTGEVVQVDAAASQFTLKNKKGESRMFSLSPKFKLKKDGKEILLTEVLGGDHLFVKYRVTDGKNIATSAKLKTEEK
jgi:hypothetical protein